MRYHTIILAIILTFHSCATARFTSEGKRVRIVTESPSGCKYLGEVHGNYRGSIDGGLVGYQDPIAFAKVDIKNKAGDIGADTVQITSRDELNVSGEAYSCDRTPASE